MKTFVAKFATVGVAVVLLGLSLLACGGSDATTTPTSGATPTPSTTLTPSTTPPPTDAFDQAGYGATTVVAGLRVPWEMRFLPDGRLLITEREGRLVVADVNTGQTSEVGRIPVLAWGEGGLMGLALDPDFPDTPKMYVAYTTGEVEDAHNRVSSFMLTGYEEENLVLGAETVLLDNVPGNRVHNGSRVAFGPDGYLWVTFGDAGSGGLAQRMDSLAGKVLRMTSDGQPAPGNPFLGDPYPFSLIYSLGHRNPQGLAFHPKSGEAYVTEHGPNENDEVNLLQPGGNYGWPNLGGKPGAAGFVDAIFAWTPTIAPAGAVFCYGKVPAGLDNAFVFVTLKESDIRVLRAVNDDFTAVAREEVLFDGEFGRLRSITVGPDGALYVGTSNYDGRGDPGTKDDRVIRIQAAE